MRLIFSFTFCEETSTPGKRNGVNRVLPKVSARWAVTTEASCEAALPTIALGCQAHAVATISLRGRSAHSASPERGINAGYYPCLRRRFTPRVEALNNAFAPLAILGDVAARAAAAVTLIKGGSAGNIVPEQCDLTLSRRLVPGETAG